MEGGDSNQIRSCSLSQSSGAAISAREAVRTGGGDGWTHSRRIPEAVIYEESGWTRKDGNSERMANRIGSPANESKV